MIMIYLLQLADSEAINTARSVYGKIFNCFGYLLSAFGVTGYEEDLL